MMRKKALGRGIAAMIPDGPQVEDNRSESGYEVELQRVKANPRQPRKDFREDELMELVESIREHGIIQPLTVRKIDDDYELIAGERRLRAARYLKLDRVPVYVIEADNDESVMEMALIENIQRENLNPVEEAQAYQSLIQTYHLSQDDVAKKVGKNRSTVTNSLRLLRLPEEILSSLVNKDSGFTAGHARALLSLDSVEMMNHLWQKILKEKLSVRAAEEWVKKLLKGGITERKETVRAAKTPYQRTVEDKLQNAFGTKVRLKPKEKGGSVEIEYYSNEDLERLLELFESIE